MSTYLSAERIQELEDILGYESNEIFYLKCALEAAGASSMPQGNKRIALIGDVILKLVHYLDGFENQLSTGETSFRCPS